MSALLKQIEELIYEYGAVLQRGFSGRYRITIDGKAYDGKTLAECVGNAWGATY